MNGNWWSFHAYPGGLAVYGGASVLVVDGSSRGGTGGSASPGRNVGAAAGGDALQVSLQGSSIDPAAPSIQLSGLADARLR